MNGYAIFMLCVALIFFTVGVVQSIRIRNYVIRREWLIVPCFLCAILFMLGAIYFAIVLP